MSLRPDSVACFSRFVAPALLCGLLLAAVPLDRLRAQELYLVRNVAVSGTGKTDRAAEQAATRRGAAPALARLLLRLTLDRHRRKLPRLAARRARALVKGIEIVSAKRRPGRFEGSLSYLFDRAKVAALLEKAGLPWSERRSEPVLVLPVWRGAAGPVLWDSPNPWRRAWTAMPAAVGLVPVLLGEGELADLQSIDGRQASALDKTALVAIAKRYGAGQVLIAEAAPGAGGVRIRMNLLRVRGATIVELRPGKAQGDGKGLAAAAQRLAARLETRWKAQVIDDSDGAVTETRVLAEFADIAAWTRIREALGDAPSVRRFRVIRFSAGDAEMALEHRGAASDLVAALRRFGLSLTRRAGDNGAAQWVLAESRRPDAGKPAGRNGGKPARDQ